MKIKELENISNLNNELKYNNFLQEKNKLNIITNFIKRIVDILFGLVGIFILIPLTIFIAIGRKILKEDDGPIFYEQLRIGKNGKYFRIYKYRTMVVDAEEKLKQYLEENEKAREEFEEKHKLKDDPRVTRIGKFLRRTSLDEMPQFWNVLKGEMSIIGPRPYLISEKEAMGNYYNEIIKCKPGITGLWQVNGRSEVTFKNRINMDIEYIENRSLWLDFRLILKTIVKVVTKSGAM